MLRLSKKGYISMMSYLSTPVEELAARMEENSRNGLTLKESLIKAIKETTKGVQRLSLRKGKKSKDAAGISRDNIVAGKRVAGKRVSFQDDPDSALASDDRLVTDPVWNVL